jgi:hypothetical protein
MHTKFEACTEEFKDTARLDNYSSPKNLIVYNFLIVRALYPYIGCYRNSHNKFNRQ